MKKAFYLFCFIMLSVGCNNIFAFDNWHFYVQSGDGLIDTQSWEIYWKIGDNGYINWDHNEVYFGIDTGSINYSTDDVYLGITPSSSVNFSNGEIHFTPQP
ncbi:MAG: hypothetical protein DRR19_11700 [Candidatus Parabeggiatoa sp. nov. 1]|nr:MAG: hypothetical protein DRR19_11700 [Gammaproteobacteria bacterium]